MVDLALLQSISYMAGALGVCVAAIYYMLNMRLSIKAREMQICREFASDYTSEHGMTRYGTMMTMEWNDYEDFMNKYGRSHPDLYGKWISQFFSFEMWGLLLERRIIDPELIYYLGGYGAIRSWDKYKDVIQGFRDNYWGPDFMLKSEYLVNLMVKIKMKHDTGFQDRRKGSWWQRYTT